MKKLESTFRNMVISLGSITIVAALLLAWVNGVTEEPIRQAEADVQNKALEEVIPEHDNNPLDDSFSTVLNAGKADSVRVVVYPALKGGKLTGAAVEASAQGFADKVVVVYGFDLDGKVRNYSVLKQSETPGLGTKMADWFRNPEGRRSVIGRNPGTENLTVSKDGGDVDAITAATISSRAFLKTLNDAFAAYKEFKEKEGKEAVHE